MAQDYYATLGVSRNSSEKEIRQAYRRLARKYHPDVNPGNKEAEGRFKAINEAYQVLSDPEKRKKYDRFGENWKYAGQSTQAGPRRQGEPFTWTFRSGGATGSQGRGSPFDLGDLGLGDIFEEVSGRRRGRTATADPWTRVAPVEVPVEVSLEEADHGTTRVIQVPGASWGSRGRRLEVTIPPGVDTGSRVHIPPADSHSPDVYLVVQVRPHPRFQRKGDALYTEVAVPLDDLVLGSELDVPTVKGQVALKVPPQTQNGQVFRLRNQGMPRRRGGRGDLYVTVKAVLPTQLTERQRELFRELRRLRTEGKGR